MAEKEGGRQDGQFIVISLVPDVCKSPSAPVPYQVVAYLDKSVRVSSNVRHNGKWAFHMGSRVATVNCHEAGIGGGIMSSAYKGFCRPIIPALKVRVNGNLHTHHEDTLMLMNCMGPDGPFNTIGYLKFLGPMYNADVGPNGTVPTGTNPPVVADSFVEGGCLPKLDSIPGLGGSSGLGDIVDLAQKAYNLATTDWSNPGAALGAIGNLAGLAGLGGLSEAAAMARQGYQLATTDWSDPGAAVAAATGIAGTILSQGNVGDSSVPIMNELPPHVITM